MKVAIQSALTVIIFTVLTGFLYPLAVAGIAHVAGAKPDQDLIGREWTEPKYFWSRPSATSPTPYNAASSGSNLGPLSETLAANIQRRVDALHEAGDIGAPPIDLITASASGLDPHISPEAARYQLARVARVRGLDASRLAAVVDAHVEGRLAGVFGEPRVNVAVLNRALDALTEGN